MSFLQTVTVMFSLLMTKERESSWRKLKEEEVNLSFIMDGHYYNDN